MLFSGELVCNDISRSRLNRLQNTLEWYLGERTPTNVTISKRDAQFMFDTELSGFDKVKTRLYDACMEI